jgi:hypothetical protein
MDYHQGLKIAGGLLALLLFIPLIIEIVKEDAAGQSGATWLLWGALDTILTISLAETGGNYLLPLGFAIGDVSVVTLLLAKRKFKWSLFETIILLMVVGCIVAWKLGGPITAAISSTLAVCVAGIPGFNEMLKNPNRRVGNVWAGYVFANILSFFGGTSMELKERFAPGVFALCALMMFAASRKRTSASIPTTQAPN